MTCPVSHIDSQLAYKGGSDEPAPTKETTALHNELIYKLLNQVQPNCWNYSVLTISGRRIKTFD